MKELILISIWGITVLVFCMIYWYTGEKHRHEIHPEEYWYSDKDLFRLFVRTWICNTFNQAACCAVISLITFIFIYATIVDIAKTDSIVIDYVDGAKLKIEYIVPDKDKTK